jgi:hypothetical protein
LIRSRQRRAQQKVGRSREKYLALVCGCGGHVCRRDFEVFDLFLDLVCERCCTGAVYDPMIECQRKRDDFSAFVLVFVRN